MTQLETELLDALKAITSLCEESGIYAPNTAFNRGLITKAEAQSQPPETMHERNCYYVTSDGIAPCTCAAGRHQAPLPDFEPGTVGAMPDTPLPDLLAAILRRAERGRSYGRLMITSKDLCIDDVIRLAERALLLANDQTSASAHKASISGDSREAAAS